MALLGAASPLAMFPTFGLWAATMGVPFAISQAARALIALLSLAAASTGRAQLTDRLPAARIASQVVAATTATPFVRPCLVPTGTTASAPAGLLPTLPTVPPMVGQCL